MAWGPQLDLKDQEGYTPLHLAVKSVDSVQSTRPVRFLLIRGARIDVNDNKERAAIDLVKDVRNRDLQHELYRMLVNKRSINRFTYREYKSSGNA